MSTREEVYTVLDGERAYQDNIWNEDTTSTGGKHTVTEWLVFMQDYLDEAKTYVSRNAEPKGSKQASHVIRKITAMGVACMEQNGALEREEF